MKRFEVDTVAGGFKVPTFGVAMGEIFGGYCIVGPPEAVTHFHAVFEIFLAAFPVVRQGYETDPENYDPLIILLTPSDHADSEGWDVQRVIVEAAFDFERAEWSADMGHALAEAEILLREAQEG
jgi:hypothetical protein